MAVRQSICLLSLLLLTTTFAAELVFRVQEEVPEGTEVASGAALAPLESGHLQQTPGTSRGPSLPTVINRGAPGASAFAFQRSGSDGPLSLVVKGRIDREAICPESSGGGPVDCRVNLRVSAAGDLHRVVIHVTDVNDHAPAWPTKEVRKFQPLS